MAYGTYNYMIIMLYNVLCKLDMIPFFLGVSCRRYLLKAFWQFKNVKPVYWILLCVLSLVVTGANSQTRHIGVVHSFTLTLYHNYSLCISYFEMCVIGETVDGRNPAPFGNR